jgi:hypothetical protein
VTNSLESARLKLKRANLHADTAKRETGRFFKRYPQASFGAELEGEPPNVKVGERFWVRIVVLEGLPDLPDSYAARFGDAIHNYRCVLDHIAWQLVAHGSIPRPREPWRVQFPIHDKRSSFRAQKAVRLPGVDSGPVKFIESRHKYRGGKATNQYLIALRNLSNDDKHHSLHVMASAVAQAHHHVTLTNCVDLAFKSPPMPPELKRGAVVAHIQCAITVPRNPKVEVNVTPSAYVVLEDGRAIFDLLGGIRAEVTEILNAPEITSAI